MIFGSLWSNREDNIKHDYKRTLESFMDEDELKDGQDFSRQ